LSCLAGEVLDGATVKADERGGELETTLA